MVEFYLPYEIQDFFASWLMLPPVLLTWPYVLIDVVIPFFLTWYIVYLMFKWISPLRRISNKIYAIVALAPALIAFRFGRMLIFFELPGIIFFQKGWSLKRKIILLIVLIVALAILYPIVSSYIIF
ncbi:MAG: hypothetical protein QMD12_03145 [Candidatus Aenigmarchaeota archaeon]|nr:hypothetical protein [Candidatus Aenigmarchaeota archaeon]